MGKALLSGYSFRINSRGVATVVKDPQGIVYGLVWRVTEENERSLDRYEGVARGLYRKETLEVQLSDGGTVAALVYIAADSTSGVPRAGYLEKIVTAAALSGFPDQYLEVLKSWRGRSN